MIILHSALNLLLVSPTPRHKYTPIFWVNIPLKAVPHFKQGSKKKYNPYYNLNYYQNVVGPIITDTVHTRSTITGTVLCQKRVSVSDYCFPQGKGISTPKTIAGYKSINNHRTVQVYFYYSLPFVPRYKSFLKKIWVTVIFGYILVQFLQEHRSSCTFMCKTFLTLQISKG